MKLCLLRENEDKTETKLLSSGMTLHSRSQGDWMMNCNLGVNSRCSGTIGCPGLGFMCQFGVVHTQSQRLDGKFSMTF